MSRSGGGLRVVGGVFLMLFALAQIVLSAGLLLTAAALARPADAARDERALERLRARSERVEDSAPRVAARFHAEVLQEAMRRIPWNEVVLQRPLGRTVVAAHLARLVLAGVLAIWAVAALVRGAGLRRPAIWLGAALILVAACETVVIARHLPDLADDVGRQLRSSHRRLVTALDVNAPFDGAITLRADQGRVIALAAFFLGTAPWQIVVLTAAFCAGAPAVAARRRRADDEAADAEPFDAAPAASPPEESP